MSAVARRVPGQMRSLAGAVSANGIVVTSGFVDPSSLTQDVPFADQASQAMRTLLDTLAQFGIGPADVIKVEAYLADSADFEAWNRIYAEVWPEPGPARTTLVVGFAVATIRFEVQAIAAQA